MTGGEGNDTYFVDNIGDKITDLTTTKGGKDTVSSAINYSLAVGAKLVGKVENLTLTGKAITGTGNDDANTINGNANANVLNGGKGNDIINGGLADDTIDGGVGVDKLTGGDGSDVYIVNNNEDTIIETGPDGDDDEVQSSATNYELGANIERLTLSEKANDGIGNELDNTLDGNDLDNTLNGDAGNDTIYGNAGNDTLDGGAGDDEIDGGDGDDVVMYQGPIDNYKITDDGGTWIVQDITGGEGEDDDGVDEGTDTITNVETIQFVDDVYTGEDVIDGEDETDPVIPTGEIPIVQFDTTDLNFIEGDFGSLTISLSTPSDEEVSVTFTTSGLVVGDLATADEDYWLGDGDTYWYDDSGSQWIEETVTFAPRETVKELFIETYYDDVPEDYEEFTVTLTEPVNAELGENAVAIVGITDDTYYYY
ncbi:hypothetical protein CKO09_09310 [Chromatium weissei]|nr:hypothetical protein [Chromatium weissei]